MCVIVTRLLLQRRHLSRELDVIWDNHMDFGGERIPERERLGSV